jgi:hypothetical protein
VVHGRLLQVRHRLSCSRKAIALAEAHARQAGAELVDCADLLVGLAQVGRGVAAAVLAENGLEPGTELGTQVAEFSSP